MTDLGTGPWQWAVESRCPTFCLTFTRGTTPEAVLRAYRVDPDLAALRTQAESGGLLPRGGGGSLLRVGTAAADWMFCYESLEPEGIKPSVMARLSQGTGTETVRVFKGADGLRTLEHYRDGRRADSVELSAALTVRGDGPHLFSLALRQRLEEHPEFAGRGPSVLLVGLDTVGRYVGGVIDQQTLQGPLLTAFLPDADREPLRPRPGPVRSRAAASPGRLPGVLPPRPEDHDEEHG
nr:DUF6461 domain-containing protein [Streptomyces canus]